jgi:hypothetical protein
LAEGLGLADLLAVGADVGAGDRAGRLGGSDVGHHADDAAEKLAVQFVSALVEVDARMPADGVGANEDVADRIHVDAALVAEVLLAGSAKDRREPRDDGRRSLAVGRLTPRCERISTGFSGGRRITVPESDRDAEPLAHVIFADAPIVVREAVDDEAVWVRR